MNIQQEVSWENAYKEIESHEYCPIEFMKAHDFKLSYTNLEIFKWLNFPPTDLDIEELS